MTENLEHRSVIPAWSMSAAAHMRQIAALSRNRRVIALGMRGHGESDKPDHGYRVGRLAADLRAAIASIRLPSLVVGARASIFSAASEEWIAAQNPAAEVAIFEAGEAGSHFMCYENPKKFNALAEAFLE